MDRFYFGFCNKTIWPLFHYFPSLTVYEEEHWRRYRGVNAAFCDALERILKPDDLVWVHDYHLMLLPRLLKNRAPDLRVGFFLHVSFTSFEVLRLLPAIWRREILTGFLGADLIGFHTHEYAQHFLQCVPRILGHEHDMGRIATADRAVKVGTFPMGIDFEKFARAAEDAAVRAEEEALRRMLAGMKVILSSTASIIPKESSNDWGISRFFSSRTANATDESFWSWSSSRPASAWSTTTR
jgi:trehalose 6-phosphate synthase/phosphatase